MIEKIKREVRRLKTKEETIIARPFVSAQGNSIVVILIGIEESSISLNTFTTIAYGGGGEGQGVLTKVSAPALV